MNLVEFIKKNYLLLLIVVIVILVIYFKYYRREHYNATKHGGVAPTEPLYKVLGNFYSPFTGGVRSELKTDCLNVGSQSCTMTDGTPGNCVLGGQCIPSFSTDMIRDEYYTNRPHCVAPKDLFSCTAYCKCLNEEQMSLGNMNFDVAASIQQTRQFFVE